MAGSISSISFLSVRQKEQNRVAAWLPKPAVLRSAGRSAISGKTAARITLPVACNAVDWNRTPFQKDYSSLTSGNNKWLTCSRLGSFGPGITPKRKMFSSLYRFSGGRFKHIRVIEPIEL